ncbi:MAG: hypothetical protein GC151_13230 [Betaproteobacteria bacterium]|nr:hypothetical protein [Betaproteobacteria bacterium]
MRLSSRLSIDEHVGVEARRAAFAWRRDGAFPLGRATDAEAQWILGPEANDLRVLLKWIATLRLNRRSRHDAVFREAYRHLYRVVSAMARRLDEEAHYRRLLRESVCAEEMRNFSFSGPSFEALHSDASLTWERMRVRALMHLADKAKRSMSTGMHGKDGPAARADRRSQHAIKEALVERAATLQQAGKLLRWQDIPWEPEWTDKAANPHAVTHRALERWTKGAFKNIRQGGADSPA